MNGDHKNIYQYVSNLRQTTFSLVSAWHTVQGQLLRVKMNRMRSILGAFAGLLLNLKLISA